MSEDREGIMGNLIRDKEYAQRAYSQEREHNLRLEQDHEQKNKILMDLEQENMQLKASHVRLVDGEKQAQRDNEELRMRNIQYQNEIEMLTSQIRVQEDAILQAQGLKDHTDKMIIDYEKVKTDLTYHIQKNEELVRELHQTQQRR